MMDIKDYEKYRKCDKCGRSGTGIHQGDWVIFDNHCECGGYIRTDFKTMYDNGLFKRGCKNDAN